MIIAACFLLLAVLLAERSKPAQRALPRFTDITGQSGVRFQTEASHTSEKYLLETMAGGVALIDYDGDGYLDLYFVNGAKLQDPMPAGAGPDKSDPRYWNRLYRNNGDSTFTDVTEKAGVRGHSFGMGAAVGDYDNDGDADLYVTNFGQSILYRNNGNGTFTDITKEAGVGAEGWAAGAAFLDYDSDGRLDLFVARYVEWDFPLNRWCGPREHGHRAYCHPDQFEPITHILYRNNGDGAFTDVSDKTSISGSPGKGLGVAFNDYDHDGRIDIAVANDSFPQQLFRNKGDGTFEETGLIAGAAYDEDGNVFAGMGIDLADYDNDGWPDLFVNALGNQKYALFRNVEGTFEYTSGPSGVAGITLLHSGWGARFLDYDNDGWKDLFVAQGHVMDNIELTQPSLRYLEPLLLMRNVRGKFQNVSGDSGEAFSPARAARGAAFGDLDNDGWVDVVVNCNNQPALILRNEGATGNHWLTVNTIGSASNKDGIGARLRLVSESGASQTGIASAAGSYLSSSDPRAHFGLGNDTLVKLLEISWPSGVVQRLENVKADQVLDVREPEASGK
ncbi:MAG: CRTAC1 family protein [Bryobacteraceae bacterium]